jgi:cell division protein FtsI/penicillin-binding protein 2
MKKPYKQKVNSKYSYYKKRQDTKEIIEKRYNILIGIIITLMMMLIINLFYVQIIMKDYYVKKIETLSQKVVEGPTAPRGRIYDRNGKLLVDNTPVKVIYYKKPSGVSTTSEIVVAYYAASLLDIDCSSLNDYNLRNFWVKNHKEEALAKISEAEWKELEERKLTLDEIEALKRDRITDEELSAYAPNDRKAAYLYYLMNIGYASSEKIIKDKDISDREYAVTAENMDKLQGFNTRLDWNRTYLYESAFRTIIGNVSTTRSGIPLELKDYYLEKGYSLNDRVGTSYLEYQYDEILRGTKNKYEVADDGSLVLVESGHRGNDIFLTIDIELQQAVEDILEKELIAAKKEPNTEYYNRSFVIINDPNTGEILAMAGKQIVLENGTYKIYDYTPGIITSPVVPGSIVKGASHIVGYNTGALKIGEIRDDACIKIAATPIKCSYHYNGLINDIDALKVSSNTYQFNTAIKVGGGTYVYNQPITLKKEAFDTYRDTFAEFGLGVKTGIDLPVESLGYKGSNTLPGYLLDFSIGQYDTYTPIQLSQYMSTIANGGKRIAPYLLKAVYDSTSDDLTALVSETKTTILETVNTEVKYLDRVKLGLKAVMESKGTGYNFIDTVYKPAGKTGTSQSFVDTNNDGAIDKQTVSTTFAGYAPYDNPKAVFTVVSPDVSHNYGKTGYQSWVNRKISYEVSKKFFEIYK